MTIKSGGLLNQLASRLPEGLLVDAAWLKDQGYSPQLQHQYVRSGWLEQPARSVYRRPRGALSWQQVIISLQTILDYSPLIVGGRTSLELQGYAHYLRDRIEVVHVYGPKAPPAWLIKLNLPVDFKYHNDQRLFPTETLANKSHHVRWNVETGEAYEASAPSSNETTDLPWGQWNWPMTLSSPERAILELLDEIPNHETFEQVDDLFSGATNLRPARLQKLLADCASVKVKRLFFFFADRHAHGWLKRLDKSAIDLGSGKRMLTKGGALDPTYQITVPRSLNGIR